MKQNSKVVLAMISAALALNCATQAAYAEQLIAVVNSISRVGNPSAPMQAATVVGKDVNLTLILSGQVYNSAVGTKDLTGISQLDIALPDKVGNQTVAEATCINLALAKKAGTTQNLPIVIVFEGQRVNGTQYKAKKLIGCADLLISK